MIAAWQSVGFFAGTAQLQQQRAPAERFEPQRQPAQIQARKPAAEAVQQHRNRPARMPPINPAQVDEIAVRRFQALDPQIEHRHPPEQQRRNRLLMRIAQQWVRAKAAFDAAADRGRGEHGGIHHR